MGVTGAIMRKNIFLMIMGIFVGLCFSCIHGRSVRSELQSLHREIGNNLIRIKKDYPKSQTVVYSVLDKLGKYYSFSKDLIAKEKEHKHRQEEEKKRADELEKRAGAMREKIKKMANVMRKVSEKIQNEYVKVDDINIAKASLAAERESFMREKEQLLKDKEKLINEKNMLLQERESILRQQSIEQPKPKTEKEARGETKHEAFVKNTQPLGSINSSVDIPAMV